MKIHSFIKKITSSDKNDYLKGWNRALKAYEELMEEDLKLKIGLHGLQNLKEISNKKI